MKKQIINSCRNYYCSAYKDNKCLRALEHRRKLYEKKLDDNEIPTRNNSYPCELYLEKEINDI